MSKKFKIILALIINLLNFSLLKAENSNIDLITNQKIETEILLTEVNFKNSDRDYLKFKIIPSSKIPPENQINLKGLEFQDDNIFKSIKKDFFVYPSEEITLYFNSSEADQEKEKTLFSTHKGLTATTDQVLLKNGNMFYDFICWKNDKPSKAELIDFKNFTSNFPITIQEIEDCLDSKAVKENQSILRNKENINKIMDWEIEKEPKIPTQNKKENIIKPKLEEKKTIKKNSKVELKKYANGNSSNEITITEIMPNPKGTDQNQEWIELCNNSNLEINLGNWKLQNSKNKTYILNNKITIKPYGCLIIPSKDSKLILANTKEKLSLLNYKNELISQVEYSNALENKSYAKIKILNKSKETTTKNNEIWEWGNENTPGQKNPDYYEIEGEITSNPKFNQIYHFSFKDKNEENFIIQFDENLLPGPLAQTTFIKGSKGKLLGILEKNKQENILKLKKYQLNSPDKSKNNQQSPLGLIIEISAIMIISSTIYLVFLKKFKWKKSIS